MRTLVVAGFGIAGFVAGYFAGALYACSGPDASNLCGLLGVFITGPIGGIAAIVFGQKMLRR